MREEMGTQELFNKYKKSFFSIVVILAALLIAFRIFTAQDKQVAALKQQKENEIKKNTALKSISELEKKLDSYKQFLSKKDASESLRKISSIAKRLSVNIVSLTPQAVEETAHYALSPFNLTVSAQNYHILAKFISELENDDDIYMIKLFSIMPQGPADAKRGPGVLQAQIQLSTILYRD
ncbi:MAG: type 4a pilus biogenesis protein PilO [Candidatus Omnitrophota bacterium]